MQPTIAIFDAGLGGLTTARRLAENRPGAHILYLGDTARGPYGARSPNRIHTACQTGLQWLLDQQPDLLVIASHSAGMIRPLEPEILGAKPTIVSAVDACVRQAVSHKGTKRIGVIGEAAVVEANVYSQAINARAGRRIAVIERAGPLLGPLILEGRLKKPETVMVVKKYLHPLKMRRVDTLIIGSGQYGPLHALIRRKIGKRTRLVEPAEAVSAQVCQLLENPEGARGQRRFFVSDYHQGLEAPARRYFGRNLKLTAWRAPHAPKISEG